MKEKNKYYYKVVSEEYPGGLFYKEKGDALSYSNDMRANEEKGYVRKVRMTDEEFNDLE